MHRILRSFASLTALTLLVACGTSPTEPRGMEEAMSAEQVELKLLSLVNGSRSDSSLGRVAMDAGVREVARAHSRSMRDKGFFSHMDPSGHTVEGRLRAAGIRFSMASENIARVPAGFDPAAEAHRQLMNSASHRVNILGPEWSLAGIGVARGGGDCYVTQVFVRP